MPDGSGHWVFLEAYHDLHCLGYLRRVLYNSTHGEITDENDPFHTKHVREYILAAYRYWVCHNITDESIQLIVSTCSE